MDSTNHTLSPEAAVFVPRYVPDAPSLPLQQIPSYMTNCYPFVQGEYDRARAPWNRYPRPPRHGYHNSPKFPRNFSGSPGNRMSGPQNFVPLPTYATVMPPQDNQWPSLGPTVQPQEKPSMPNLMSPLLMEEQPVHLDKGNENTLQHNNRAHRKKHSKDTTVWDFNGNHGNKKGSNQETHVVSNTNHEEHMNKDKIGYHGNTISESHVNSNDLGRMSLDNKPTSNHGNLKIDGEISSKKEWGLDSVKIIERSAGEVKGKKRQRRRSNSGKNSGSGLENSLSKNSGVSVTRRDVSCQTDFPDHISELSLAQYVSELYKGEQLCRAGTCQGDCDSSDTGMDSDSGYNSPLHKKTQVSNGYNFPSLNSQAGSVKMKPVFSLTQEQEQNYSNNNSNNRERVNDRIPTINDPLSIFDKVVDGAQSAAPQKMSYAFMAQKKPSPVIYENKNQPKREENAKPLPTKLLNNKSGTKKERSKEKGDLKRAKRLLGGASDGEPLSAKENDKQSQVSGLSENSQNESKNATGETTEGKKKRRRNRKRRKKKKTDANADAESDGEDENNPSHQVELHFEDEEEFPDLSCNTVPGRVDVMPLHDSVPLSYSAMLKQKKSPQPVNSTVPLNAQTRIQDETTGVPEAASTTDPLSEVRGVRRRRKRHEMVEKAAEEELAEINLEQQMLRELNLQQKQKVNGKDSVAQQPGILKVTPKPQPSGKKSKQGMALDLSAMIIALEKKVPETPQKTQETAAKKKTDTKTKEQQKPGSKHNFLDSTAPVKRGKERENPKPKKPSSLKKVILKEREEKKKMRLLDDSETPNDGVSLGIGMVSGIESDLSQDALSSKSSIDYGCLGTPASNDLSPISQTSPISMSPLSSGISPQSSEINSPIAGTIEKEVRMKIHSRRFREYCNQVLNKDIDNCCTSLLQDLVRFQDRMYHKDPVKAKSKRRLVLGLREVTKHLKLKKIKCVVVSPNLEKIQSKGGLDDALNNILNLCNEQNVPFVFALGRRALGRACAKLVPVSVVGIFNYDGSDDNFRQLMDLTEEARQAYKEMVSVIEKEINDYPRLGAAAAVPHIYAHMGHSRTPSGASVLSFTSSILSEPISENYPHSEPETDSKGYEIVKDGDKNMNPGGHLKNSSMTEVLKSQMKIIYPHVNVDIDDGNEADTEECNERIRSSEGRYHGSDDNESEGSDNLSQPGSDTIKALPHIDSIHSSTYDLNAEILSQHSGKNVDNCDTISTHSSRTLGDGSSTILADPGERSKHDTPKSTESPSSTLQRGKVIDAERIQNWVDQTQSRLEDLQYLQENTEESSGSESDTGEEETADDLNLSNGNVSELKGKKDGTATQGTEKEKVNSEAGKNSVPESGNGKSAEASDNTNCNGQNRSESNSGNVGCSGAIDNVNSPESHNISLQTEENEVSDKNIEDENPSGSDITNDNMQNVPPSQESSSPQNLTQTAT